MDAPLIEYLLIWTATGAGWLLLRPIVTGQEDWESIGLLESLLLRPTIFAVLIVSLVLQGTGVVGRHDENAFKAALAGTIVVAGVLLMLTVR